MVCISKGYRFTVVIYFKLELLGEEIKDKVDEGNVRLEV
jgi:hypothetical protein